MGNLYARVKNRFENHCMKKDAYLHELSQKLPQGDLSERFIKELQDHLEDAESKGTLKEPLNDSLGDATLLQKHFANVLFRRNLFYGTLQTLLLSLLSSFLYIAAMWSQGIFNLNFRIWDFSWYLPIELLFLLFLFLLYYRGLPDIFLDAPSFWHRLPFIFVIFLFPSLTVALYAFSSVAMHGGKFFGITSDYVLPFSLIPLAVGIIFFSYAYFLRRKKHLRQRVILTRRKKIFWTLGILFILAIIGARLILRLSAVPESQTVLENLKPLFIVSSPFFMLDFIILMISNITLAFVPITLRFWILGIILVLLAGIILLQLLSYFLYRQPETFPLFRLGILVYILLLLIIPYQEPAFISPLPIVNISERIEKRQMGPFYSMTKYFNANEGDFGQYNLYGGEKGFVLGQGRGSSEEINYFLVKNIQSTSDFDITSTTTPGPGFHVITHEYRYDDPLIQCVDKKENFGLSPNNGCDTLTFMGHEVFSYPGWFGWLQGVDLTTDKKFMIVQISMGAYDPSVVYLIDLRSLQVQK